MSTLLEQAELAADLLGAAAHENGRIVCTAESLTGGMVSELLRVSPDRRHGLTAVM